MGTDPRIEMFIAKSFHKRCHPRRGIPIPIFGLKWTPAWRSDCSVFFSEILGLKQTWVTWVLRLVLFAHFKSLGYPLGSYNQEVRARQKGNSLAGETIAKSSLSMLDHSPTAKSGITGDFCENRFVSNLM
jgi:hypothetical protein